VDVKKRLNRKNEDPMKAADEPSMKEMIQKYRE
jgi:hypothetical protein